MDDTEVTDNSGDEKIDDEGVVYQITSFGADFLVDGLVARLDRGDIYTPGLSAPVRLDGATSIEVRQNRSCWDCQFRAFFSIERRTLSDT